MEDLQTRLENLRLEADDCELIARLSADLKRRAFFAKLSVQLRASARDVEQTIRSRTEAENAANQIAVDPRERSAALLNGF